MTRFTLHAPAFADPGVEQPGEILTLGWAARRRGARAARAGLALPGGPARAALAQLHGAALRPGARDDRRRLLPARRHRPRVGVGAPRARPATPSATPARARTGSPTRRPPGSCWRPTRPGCRRCWRSSSRCRPGCARSRSPRSATRASASRSRPRADVDLRWISRGGRPAGHDDGADRRAAGAARCRRSRPGVGRRRGAGDARRAPPPRRRAPRGRPSMNVMGYWKHRATPDDVDY